ncbi:hypothetical protein K490DRAFT_60177 [Saccharata proteae CBS 121410]|uniref:Uncharacterized protein n=1 Tax=Saccharata proteae CBS 121410 TaxID=1314787 RepID=A0A9P4HNJ0_9PEZI|nr:hypothetical protein K490DRAFT_60177 [Saccharata proteae CBS 121410]
MNLNVEPAGPPAQPEMLRTFSNIASSSVGPISRGSVGKPFAKTDKQVIYFADWLQRMRKVECNGYYKAAWDLICQPYQLEQIFSAAEFEEHGRIFLLHALNIMWMGMVHTRNMQDNPNHLTTTAASKPASPEGYTITGSDKDDTVSTESPHSEVISQITQKNSDTSGEVKQQDSADHLEFNVDKMVESGRRSRLAGIESAAHTPHRVVSPSEPAATGASNMMASVQEPESARAMPVQPVQATTPFFSPSMQPTVIARRGVHVPPLLRMLKRPGVDVSTVQAPQGGSMPLTSMTAGVGSAGSMQTGAMHPLPQPPGASTSPRYSNLQPAALAAPMGPATMPNYSQPQLPQYVPSGVPTMQMIGNSYNPYAYQMHPEGPPNVQPFHDTSFRGHGRHGSMRSIQQSPRLGNVPPYGETVGRYMDGSHGQRGGRSHGHRGRRGHSQDMSSMHEYRGPLMRESHPRGGLNDRRRSETQRGPPSYYANNPAAETFNSGVRNAPYVHMNTTTPKVRAAEPFPPFDPHTELDSSTGCGPEFIGTDRSDVDTIWVSNLARKDVKLSPKEYDDMAITVSTYFTDTFHVTPKMVHAKEDVRLQPVALVSLVSADDARKVIQTWKTFPPWQRMFHGCHLALQVAQKHYAFPKHDHSHRTSYRKASDAYEGSRKTSYSRGTQVEVLRRPADPHYERKSSDSDKLSSASVLNYSAQDARSSIAPQSSRESESPSPIKGKKKDKQAAQTRNSEGKQSGHGGSGIIDNVSESKENDAKSKSRSATSTSPAVSEELGSTTSSNRPKRQNRKPHPKADRVGSNAGPASKSLDTVFASGESKNTAGPEIERKTGGEAKAARKNKSTAQKKPETRETASKTAPVISSSETKGLRHSSSRYFTPNELPPKSESDEVVAPTMVPDKSQDKHTQAVDQTDVGGAAAKKSDGKSFENDHKEVPALPSSANSPDDGIHSNASKSGDSGSAESDSYTVLIAGSGEKPSPLEPSPLGTLHTATPRTPSSSINPQPNLGHADTPEGAQSFVTTKESPDSPPVEDYVDAEAPKEEFGQADPIQAGKQDSGSLHPMAAAKAQKKADQAAMKKKKKQEKNGRTKSGQYAISGGGQTGAKVTPKSDSPTSATPQPELPEFIQSANQGRKGKGRTDTISEAGSPRTPSLASSSSRIHKVEDEKGSGTGVPQFTDVTESKRKGKGRAESKSEARSAKPLSVASSSDQNHVVDDGKIFKPKVEVERQTTEEREALKSIRNDSLAQNSGPLISPPVPHSPRSTASDNQAVQGSGTSTPKRQSSGKATGKTHTKSQTSALVAVPDLSRLGSLSPTTRKPASAKSDQSKVQDAVSDTSSRTLEVEKSDDGGQVGLGIEMATMDQTNPATTTLSPEISKRLSKMPSTSIPSGRSPDLTQQKDDDFSESKPEMNIPKPPTHDADAGVDEATVDLSELALSDPAPAAEEVALSERKKKRNQKKYEKKKNNKKTKNNAEDEAPSHKPRRTLAVDARDPGQAAVSFNATWAKLKNNKEINDEERKLEWSKFILRHWLRRASADGSATLYRLYNEQISPGILSDTDEEIKTRWRLIQDAFLPGGDFDILARNRLLLRAEDPEALGESTPFSTLESLKDVMYREWGPLTRQQADGLTSHLTTIYGEHYADWEFWGQCLEEGPGTADYNLMIQLVEEELPWAVQNELEKLKAKMEGRPPSVDSQFLLARKRNWALKAKLVIETREEERLRVMVEQERKKLEQEREQRKLQSQ